MAKVTVVKDFMTNVPFFRNAATNVEYRRIVGGLAWPDGGKQGCAVILGELRNSDNTLQNRHHIHRLDERLFDDVSNVVAAAATMQDEWMTTIWATPINDSRVYLIDDYNDERRKMRRPGLRYGNPYRWAGKGEGLISYYMELVVRRTRDEKTLTFNLPSACADAISKLDSRDEDRKPTDFPAAAALFFALAEIDGNPMPLWGRRERIDMGPADLVGGY